MLDDVMAHAAQEKFANIAKPAASDDDEIVAFVMGIVENRFRWLTLDLDEVGFVRDFSKNGFHFIHQLIGIIVKVQHALRRRCNHGIPYDQGRIHDHINNVEISPWIVFYQTKSSFQRFA